MEAQEQQKTGQGYMGNMLDHTNSSADCWTRLQAFAWSKQPILTGKKLTFKLSVHLNLPTTITIHFVVTHIIHGSKPLIPPFFAALPLICVILQMQVQ